MSSGSVTAICLVTIAALPAGPAASQPLVPQGQAVSVDPIISVDQVVDVTATLAPAVSRSQTVRFDAAALIKPIIAALGAAGYRTAGDGGRVDLAAHVVAYDSGSYVGFAKTARMAVDFKLADANGAALKQWHADCNQKVGFNLQSTATRNAAAVAACYDELADAAVDGIKAAR